MANLNFNEDKIQEVARESLQSNRLSEKSFFKVLVSVLLGALFAGSAVALDSWRDRNKQNAPTAQQEAPIFRTQL